MSAGDWYSREMRRQVEYCQHVHLPLCAPPDGVCWSCRRQIMDDARTQLSADKELITGCPHCSRSFVE